MATHVIFAAPFFMGATNRFISGATQLPGVDLTLVSQDPIDKLPTEIRQRVSGHWQVADALDPGNLIEAARNLQSRFGRPSRYIATLEQLQVPLAHAREALEIPGLGVESAKNFRDKARMKTVLREAGVSCAKHALVGDRESALKFAGDVGYPLVVKPPAGAGGKGTYRLDDHDQLTRFLERFVPDRERPTLYEEFVRGTEFSFDSVMVQNKLIWHSISRYMPSPLEVLENPWIQWCVMLPRDISVVEFDPIRSAAENGLHALGLETGLSHMEWFRMMDGRIAIS